jgi:adenylate cyclase
MEYARVRVYYEEESGQLIEDMLFAAESGAHTEAGRYWEHLWGKVYASEVAYARCGHGSDETSSHDVVLKRDSVNMEIERKFLVEKLPDDLQDYDWAHIEQGYIAIEEGREVRIRSAVTAEGQFHWMTVKDGRGLSRRETEIEISKEQYWQLRPLTGEKRLTKMRRRIPYGDHTIELDIFYANAAISFIAAEVEFADEAGAEAFQPPEWFGQEVTGRPEYSNSYIAINGRPVPARV